MMIKCSVLAVLSILRDLICDFFLRYGVALHFKEMSLASLVFFVRWQTSLGKGEEHCCLCLI